MTNCYERSIGPRKCRGRQGWRRSDQRPERVACRIFPDLDAASSALALHLRDRAKAAMEERDRFSFVLTGGKTPRRLYELLGADDAALPWDQTHFFWGDERCLPPAHEASNYHLASATFLDQLGLPAEHIHRIRGEMTAPDQEAMAYEQEIVRFFAAGEDNENKGLDHRFSQCRAGFKPAPTLPMPHLETDRYDDQGKKTSLSLGEWVGVRGIQALFDVLLLGMGGDGHVASLFPGHPLLGEQQRLVTALGAPMGSPPVDRITMTLPLINQSREVIFLIAGSDKMAIMEEILANPCEAAAHYPAALVRPVGKILWFAAREQC